MNILKYIIIYTPLAVLFTVLIILALGPAYLEFRDWCRQKKADEYEQKHGYKPRKKQYTGGHF
ncbi:MAG TPA: hypothetical protein VLH56_09895 [Dissulfurispiraceae bacterium]|nr:hypothetical protein [Dissulfurispiraceae bacterium]